jgi:hypothetical protein
MEETQCSAQMSKYSETMKRAEEKYPTNVKQTKSANNINPIIRRRNNYLMHRKQVKI